MNLSCLNEYYSQIIFNIISLKHNFLRKIWWAKHITCIKEMRKVCTTLVRKPQWEKSFVRTRRSVKPLFIYLFIYSSKEAVRELGIQSVEWEDGRSRWLRGLRRRSALPTCWDCGFEFLRGLGCLSCVSVVCCQVHVSATGRSLVQGSPTKCVCVKECDQIQQ
jgi:hypothetical protein